MRGEKEKIHLQVPLTGEVFSGGREKEGISNSRQKKEVPSEVIGLGLGSAFRVRLLATQPLAFIRGKKR